MGIKDRFKSISSNASLRTEQESLNSPQAAALSRAPRTAPGMAAAASRMFSEEKKQLLDEIEELRAKLEASSRNQAPGPEVEAELARLRQELREKESAYGIKRIKVSECHVKPASGNRPLRKRKLSDKDFEALRASILSVGMSVPIQVEPREEGGYWIVAGHNRHEVHAREGMEEIRAEVVNPQELDVEAAALVSNLLTPELGTFEFYRGIRYFRDELGKTSKEIAEMTGRGKSTISEYFSLDSAPVEVLDFLEESNLQLGSSAVAEFCKLVTPGNVKEAVQALKNYQAGKNWKGEMAALGAQKAARPALSKPSLIRIEKGGKSFATVSVRKNNLAIRFNGTSVPADIAERIQKILEESAV